MKNTIIVLISAFCVVFSLLGNAAEQPSTAIKILDRPLIPTGYGLTLMQSKDFYLGQLAIDKSSVYRTPEDLVFIDAARRMEFKFVNERKMSGKAFARKLAEGMKINNELEALKDSSSTIIRFKRFFKKAIKAGDVIRFDYHPDFGTRIYHNKRLLGEINNSREFYSFLMNIWLGDRPPSSTFKSGILGQNGDEYAVKLQQRFNSL